MATKTVTDASFNDDVLGSSEPVLVDFWADWCGPCKMIAPSLEQISEDLAGKVTIAKANLDDAGEAAMKYNIRTIPQLVLFQGGQEKARWSRGAAPKSVLQGWLEEQIGSGERLAS
jgi:thioredoxin 1